MAAAEAGSRRSMVVLHGLGDSREGYRWLPPALSLHWMNYLLVDAPDPYFGGFSWYDFSGDPAPGIERSRRLLFDVVESLEARGCPAAQMIVFGFSQGCLMAWELGLRYPKRFAGLIGISGYLHDPRGLVEAMSPVARRQRFLITHGTLDPLIPCEGVREQVRLMREAGVRIEWHEFPKAHTIHDEPELRVIRDFVVSCYVGEPGGREEPSASGRAAI